MSNKHILLDQGSKHRLLDFSSTIRRIWRVITVTLASPSALHWLRFFVHPRNQLISLSLYILLVWAYHCTTAFPLMQPINADIQLCILWELFPFLDFKFWLRFFVHPRNELISLQPMLVRYYNFTTTFQIMQPINAENSVCIMRELWLYLDLESLVTV